MHEVEELTSNRRSRSGALTPVLMDKMWLAQGGRAACSCTAIHVAVSAGSEQPFDSDIFGQGGSLLDLPRNHYLDRIRQSDSQWIRNLIR